MQTYAVYRTNWWFLLTPIDYTTVITWSISTDYHPTSNGSRGGGFSLRRNALDLAPRSTFRLIYEMEKRSDSRRLLIGEAAKLLGITPKAIRHYEKLGLLDEPERTASGYRLYTADDLLRLHRIKKLQSFGMSLESIKGVPGDRTSTVPLKPVLEALLREVEARIEFLEKRRSRLLDALSRENAEQSEETPRIIKLWEEKLGQFASSVSPEAMEQERRMWTTLDAFEWPDGYEEFQESLILHFAEHPDEYRKVLEVGERFAALADTPADSPEIERIAKDFLEALKDSKMLDEGFEGAEWDPGPLGGLIGEMSFALLSPAQRRVIEVAIELQEGADEES